MNAKSLRDFNVQDYLDELRNAFQLEELEEIEILADLEYCCIRDCSTTPQSYVEDFIDEGGHNETTQVVRAMRLLEERFLERVFARVAPGAQE